MYPYRDRVRWLLFGRYSHLVRAVHGRRRAVQDTVLQERVASLRTWNAVRFIVSVPLTLGLVATLLSGIARAVPGGLDDRLAGTLLAVLTGVSGLMTLVYLFLTRLLGQLEIDILTILTLEHGEA